MPPTLICRIENPLGLTAPCLEETIRSVYLKRKDASTYQMMFDGIWKIAPLLAISSRFIHLCSSAALQPPCDIANLAYNLSFEDNIGDIDTAFSRFHMCNRRATTTSITSTPSKTSTIVPGLSPQRHPHILTPSHRIPKPIYTN